MSYLLSGRLVGSKLYVDAGMMLRVLRRMGWILYVFVREGDILVSPPLSGLKKIETELALKRLEPYHPIGGHLIYHLYDIFVAGDARSRRTGNSRSRDYSAT
jgi:hypothetical protein